MLLQSAVRTGGRRRGVILMVVLALLTLFAILGIAFVYYSDGSATSSRIFREQGAKFKGGGAGAEVDQTVSDATVAWPMFLGQLVYDVNDDDFGIYSSMRGSSLGRTMYDWKDDPYVAGGPLALNDKPYNGTGRLSEALLGGLDGQQGVNYMYFPADGYLRDPGRTGTRAYGAARNPITGGLNVSYTYPDQNNMFLAVLDPNTGQVTVPSYNRPWLFNPGKNFNDQTNANWKNAAGRHMTMRPRPIDMDPTFPYPTDAIGDVKNLEWAPGGNDSIWIDFNAPVQTMADGSKYKLLAAPLILAMDGRINVNVAGNLLATVPGPQGHASNQGWGPWEVSQSQVLNANANEWTQAFLGNGTINGRYGPTKVPIGGLPFAGGTLPRAYYPMDYNAIQDAGSPTPGALSKQWQPPGTAPAVPYQVFPYYDSGSYGNAAPVETKDHPSIFNPLVPQGTNRTFGADSLAALLRRYNVGGDLVSSDLTTLLPLNLLGTGITDLGARGRRALITTHSFDLDRPASTPYVWDPNDPTAGNRYRYNGAINPPRPQGGALNFPLLALRGGAVPAGSEFDPNTWQSVFAALGRVDLGRKLTNYPAPDPATWQFKPADAALVQAAVADRQALARDIFTRLWSVTGAVGPNLLSPIVAAGKYDPSTPEYQAMRWLAQLAVNIVDFIDADDYSTPFNWYGSEWLFGTEVPRLVINEYYAQWDNDATDIGAMAPYLAKVNNRVNVWIELHNPFPVDNADPQKGTARLQNSAYPVYQVLLCQKPNVNLRDPANLLGTPDAGNPATLGAGTFSWGPADNATPNLSPWIVQPGFGAFSGTAGQNQGYYVLGPNTPYAAPLTGTNPSFTTTSTSPLMSFTLPLATDPTATAPSILLQRLANPYLPPQSNSALANYNPYVTVDYVNQVAVNDGRLFSTVGALTPPTVTSRVAQGRRHPFAAEQGQWKPQNPLPLSATQPQNTFYRLNSRESTAVSGATAGQTIQFPFDTLYQPDRQPMSLMDLLHVSGFKPHELTQQFIDSTGTSFGHRARWTEPATRLARAFEYLTISNRMNGMVAGGRIPGKLNLNEVRHQLVFRALCDPQAANQFTQPQVDAIFTAVGNARGEGAAGFPGTTGPTPFQGLATGSAAGSDPLSATPRGLNNTLLQSGNLASTAWDGTQLRLLEPSVALPRQPLQRFELLSKAYGNLTTRSNVFGVWVTFGFFKVIDDTTKPVKLGAEVVWPSSNTTIRRKFFAIVDRTQLQAWPTVDSNNQPMVRAAAPVAIGPAPVALINGAGTAITSVLNPNTNRTWTLQPNAVLTYEPGTINEETVVVQAGNTATFTKAHPLVPGQPIVVISRANPGPWPLYDPNKDASVVPYLASMN